MKARELACLSGIGGGTVPNLTVPLALYRGLLLSEMQEVTHGAAKS
ncbi:hypothetical protein HQ563_03310 [bacterium]|nr:hypothetical protein [bacterium]